MNREATQPPTNPQQIRSYAELQRQLHRDLLAQHPEWIEADGNSPKCDEYDRRLAKTISVFNQLTRSHG